MSEKNPVPLHVTQAFGLKLKEHELDFFDTNLEYDSRVFIDPFLLRKSDVKKERELFGRFGDFFRYTYDQSMNVKTSREEYRTLMELLNFSEPKEIGLGYAEESNDGSSPGTSFATLLVKFFLNSSARRLVKEDNLYPDKKFNPVTIEIFTRKLGVDGLSDITANLIMDYLVAYTQRQCRKLGIPMKKLPLNADGFDFSSDQMCWRGGGHYLLPENPLKVGRAIIFVPKRLLRAPQNEDEAMVNKVAGILESDPGLRSKFTRMLEKNIEEFEIDDIRRVMLEDASVFKRYMQVLYSQERYSYDFDNDPNGLLVYKKYVDLFKEEPSNDDFKNDEEVLVVTIRFIEKISFHLSKTDIWRDLWKPKKDGKLEPNAEKPLQRIIFAMGQFFFVHYPQITFEPEVGTGNGPVDFNVIFKDCRIAIEFKRLLSSSYLEGIKSQLPEYAVLMRSRYAMYVTVQHYTKSYPRGDGKDDNGRVVEIESAVPDAEETIKKDNEGFKKLYYYNIDVSPKPSASKSKSSKKD